ncbi:MAG: glycosyltransferase [Acidobacteriia bacterium]|nr:glycosyltransferase [Terriglobia bacterium]
MIAVRTFPRVALMADTFYEVNGAARTCREWEAFARRRRIPFFCVRRSPRAFRGTALAAHHTVWTMDIGRSALAYRIDTDLYFDALFLSALGPIMDALRRFQPEIIHITSPGDMGILGVILAAWLKKPLAFSWHTNLHEFAGRRLRKVLSWLPGRWPEAAAEFAEVFSMDRLCWLFRRSDVHFAPNPELIGILSSRTGKPAFPMGRGVDTELFSPSRRQRNDNALVLGFVGRIMPEKNLRILPRVAEALRAAGITDFRFQITGAGSERGWLEQNLPKAEFTGVLTGEALAQAYANMDLFVFPSRTDTFGNVVQEALASGVPAVVSDAGGPRFIVDHGANGLIAGSEEEFCAWVVALARDETLRHKMGLVARRSMLHKSWDRVFEEVYEGYANALQHA